MTVQVSVLFIACSCVYYFMMTLLHQLLLVVVDIGSHVLDSPCDECSQEGNHLLELLVIGVVVPALNWDSIVGLALEVVLDVVYYDYLLQITPQERQVLDIDAILVTSAVSVKTMGDESLLV
jgi:hypothetical protein